MNSVALRHPAGLLALVMALAVPACDSPGDTPASASYDVSGGGDGAGAGDAEVVDASASGSVVARYTLAPGTCADSNLAQVRARVYGDADEVLEEATLPCETTGAVTVEGVPAGVWTVVVDGLSDEAAPRATHYAVQASVLVPSGGQVETSTLTLTLRPATLHVRWVFENGLPCVDNGISWVELTVLDTGNNVVQGPASGACDVTFVDPVDGTTRSGVLVGGLTPGEAFDVVVRGFASLEEPVEQLGTVTSQVLAPGEHRIVNVMLSPVP